MVGQECLLDTGDRRHGMQLLHNFWGVEHRAAFVILPIDQGHIIWARSLHVAHDALATVHEVQQLSAT